MFLSSSGCTNCWGTPGCTLRRPVEYREQGCANVQNWIDTSVAKLKTASAQALAEAALNMSSIEWQKTYLG